MGQKLMEKGMKMRSDYDFLETTFLYISTMSFLSMSRLLITSI